MAVQNTINTEYCESKISVLGGTDAYDNLGGMKGMGGALGRGMVLAFSIWEGGGTGMQWLDGVDPAGGNASAPGVARGDCPANSGTLMSQYPNAAVTFSNIRVCSSCFLDIGLGLTFYRLEILVRHIRH